jgi:glutathione synthase/RimK-type ligase-like ATP-grasp enzyme
VNSSPGLEGIETATGKDVASSIVEYAVAFGRRAARRRKAV